MVTEKRLRVAQPDDFFMRSLWPHPGPLETSLSELQEVGHELAATPGTHNFGGSGPIYHDEVSIVRGN